MGQLEARENAVDRRALEQRPAVLPLSAGQPTLETAAGASDVPYMAKAYKLRARLRPLAVAPRVRDCGARAICELPELVVRDYEKTRRAWWHGILRCGRQHACPVCAAKRAAERRAELERLMAGDVNGRWQMVTFTLRHNRKDALRSLCDKLMRAWRRVRARRHIRKIFDERVTASVRSLEVTRGNAYGWHPHIHLLLRTSHWNEAERAALQWAWLEAVDGVAGVAVVWSEPFTSKDKARRAKYLAKMAAELSGAFKRPKQDNVTPWHIAKRALRDEGSRYLWDEYQRSMRGRRSLEFDERAKAMTAPEPDAEEHLREWRIRFTSDEYRALARCESVVPTVLHEILETALTAGPDPPEVVREAVWDWLYPKARPLRRALPASLDLEISFVHPYKQVGGCNV